MTQTSQGFNAFWFLRSLEWAKNTSTCSSNPPTDPGNWGLLQAQQFVNAINALPALQRTNYLQAVFADVEVLTLGGCDQGTDPTHCAGPKNAGYWYFDATSQAENVKVINGFFSALCNVYQFCNMGVYTSFYHWPEITNNVGPSAIDRAGLVWLASMQAPVTGQNSLSVQEQLFTSQAYSIYSWQYATNDSRIQTDCEASGPTYATAQAEANNASPWIQRFDVWTNGRPDIVC